MYLSLTQFKFRLNYFVISISTKDLFIGLDKELNVTFVFLNSKCCSFESNI